MHRYFQDNQMLKNLNLYLCYDFFQSVSFIEQIWRTISLSEIDSDHRLLINVTTQVTTYVTWCF